MDNNFKLENLGRKALKNILSHLSNKEKLNLLICCKEWNKLLTPILWEDINLSCSDYDFKTMCKSFKNFNYYIQCLNIPIYSNIPINSSTYPNCKKVYLTLYNYLKYKPHLKHIPYIGLYYTNNIDGMSTEEYISAHKICVKELFREIQCLKVTRPYSYFVTSIIPYLPLTITTLIFNSTPNENHTYYFKLLCELGNLRRLELNYFTMELNNLNFFLNKQYLQLKHLVIDNIGVEGLKVVSINLSNYPKLESLTIRGWFMVIFNGRSNLKMLSLCHCNLTKATINNDMFPKINQFLFTSGSYILSRHLYSILNMPTLTYLELSRSQLTFLIKEIYPKKSNSILKLKVANSTLGIDFLKFLYGGVRIGFLFLSNF